MSQPAGLRTFLSLASRFPGDDKALAALLGIARSTLWRIKKGKIQKLDWYNELLAAHLAESDREPLDQVVDDLKLWSSSSAEVRTMLFSLHRIVQNSATS